MYRSDLKTRDKGGAIAAVIAIHAVLLFVFMHLSGRMDLADPQRVLQVFEITEVPPPPPPTPVEPQRAEETQKPKEQEGAASRENIRSQATPVVSGVVSTGSGLGAANDSRAQSTRRGST